MGGGDLDGLPTLRRISATFAGQGRALPPVAILTGCALHPHTHYPQAPTTYPHGVTPEISRPSARARCLPALCLLTRRVCSLSVRSSTDPEDHAAFRAAGASRVVLKPASAATLRDLADLCPPRESAPGGAPGPQGTPQKQKQQRGSLSLPSLEDRDGRGGAVASTARPSRGDLTQDRLHGWKSNR